MEALQNCLSVVPSVRVVGHLVNRDREDEAAYRRWTSARTVLYDLGWLEGAPVRAQPVQLASLEVVSQSSSFTGLPQ